MQGCRVLSMFTQCTPDMPLSELSKKQVEFTLNHSPSAGNKWLEPFHVLELVYFVYILYYPVCLFEPVLNGSVLVLFSSEKNLLVQFSVLKRWGENWTELNFGNTTQEVVSSNCETSHLWLVM